MRFTRLREVWNNILDVPSTDPEDSRRRKLLNILLISVAVLPMPLIPLSLIFGGTPDFPRDDAITTVVTAIAVIISSVVLYVVNRYLSGRWAATLFLLFLCLVFVYADTPDQLVNGRSLILFTIPVVFSAILLGAVSSFVFAIICSAEIAVIAILNSLFPNIPAMVSLLALAVVSWLSSRGLEQALADLRRINVELDRRVEERTRDLSAALTRELQEAGRSQAILEGIADGVAVFDTNGISIVANPALSDLLGIPIAELKDVSMEAILQQTNSASSDREVVLSLLADPQEGHPSVRLHSGKRTLLVNAAQVQTGLGNTIGTVAVFRDFTREAEVEQMKNTFVGMVSHELRTPLNAIIGYAEMVREKVYGPITEHQSSIMTRVENSGKRLLSLVSDLLDQAQIEAGKMKINAEPLKVSGLTEALFALEKQVNDKGLKLSAHISPDMPAEVVGDSHRLQQVLINLVGNSVKFMTSGEIRVSIQPVDESRWSIVVADTGPGIPVEAQQFVFESFRQVEGVTTREHGGIGLGLAIVKSLVGLMGGEIKLWSEVDKGTTFTVILPYHVPQETK